MLARRPEESEEMAAERPAGPPPRVRLFRGAPSAVSKAVLYPPAPGSEPPPPAGAEGGRPAWEEAPGRPAWEEVRVAPAELCGERGCEGSDLGDARSSRGPMAACAGFIH